MRQGCIALASYTGWQLSELKELPVSEFIWWLEALPKKSD